MTEDERFEALILGLNDCGAAGQREWRALVGDEDLLGRLLEGGGLPAGRFAMLRRSLAEELAGEAPLERGLRVRAEAEGLGLEITSCRNARFPPGLAALANPPLVLFHRGNLPAAGERSLAVVGSRRASRHGREQARRIARGLAERGVAIVSGLARGVDRAAHEGALEGGGRTHALLGSGLARLYPPEHAALAEAMGRAGSVISEFSPTMPPLPGNFPRRNRLIAALADALLLIEAGEKSGGLITVRWASDLGREVFVLPGQVDNPAAAGCLALLRDGARCVRDHRDLLVDLGWETAADDADEADEADEAGPALAAGERRLLALLDHEAVELEVLLGALDMGPGEVLTRLLALELRGLVAQEEGLRFRRLQ